MGVRSGILLLFAAACCSALDITEFKFIGHDGKFSFTNDIDENNKFTCTVTVTQGEAANPVEFQITDSYDKSVLCQQTVDFKGSLSSVIPCQLNVDLPMEIKEGDETRTYKAEATLKDEKDPKKDVKKTKEVKVNILDIRRGTEEKQEITTTGCSVNLDIVYPYTFPKGRAECGVWNKRTGQFVKNADVKGIDYFDSQAAVPKWTDADFNGRKSLRLSQNIDLTKLQGYKDLATSKRIRCRLFWEGPYDYTITEKDYIPHVENAADKCDPNPLDALAKKMGNTNIKFVNSEKIQSCYKAEELNRMSYYRCDYNKLIIESVCDTEDYKYKLQIGNGIYKDYVEKDARKFIQDCLHEPKTLKVQSVGVEGTFKNVIRKNGINQNVTCSFEAGEEDIYADKISATVTMLADDTIIKRVDIPIKKFNGTKTFNSELPLPTTTFTTGKPAKLKCRVKLGMFAKEQSIENEFDVIEIADEPTATDVTVDHEKCEVDFNQMKGQPTKPEGVAFCGIWVSESSDMTKGDWLEGPDEMVKNSGKSFSSNRNHTRWETNVDINGFTQYTLRKQKIAISHLESKKHSWVKCEWMFPHFNSSLENAVISTFTSDILVQNEADSCGANPVTGKDLDKENAKKIVNVVKTSCYSDQVQREISVNVQCTNTKNVASVTCENGKYMMKTASKTKGEEYTEDNFKKFLQTCGAGSVFASNVLMGVLMLVLYFKSH